MLNKLSLDVNNQLNELIVMKKISTKTSGNIEDKVADKKIQIDDDQFEFSSSIAKAKLYSLIKKVMRTGKDVKIISDGRNLVTLTLRKPLISMPIRLKAVDVKNNWADVISAVHAVGAVYYFRVIPSVEDGTEIKNVYLVKGGYRNSFIEDFKLLESEESVKELNNIFDAMKNTLGNYDDFLDEVYIKKLAKVTDNIIREKHAESEKLKMWN